MPTQTPAPVQQPLETPAPIVQQKLDDLTLEGERNEEANLGSIVFC